MQALDLEADLVIGCCSWVGGMQPMSFSGKLINWKLYLVGVDGLASLLNATKYIYNISKYLYHINIIKICSQVVFIW